MKIQLATLAVCMSFALHPLVASAEDEISGAFDHVPVNTLSRGDESGKMFQIRDALCLGKFEAASLDEVLAKSYINETSAKPKEGDTDGDKIWTICRSKFERFVVRFMPVEGEYFDFAVYFSYWIHSDIGTVDSDAFKTILYADKAAKLFVNGEAQAPASEEQTSDDRTLYYFKNNLQPGWTHFLIKLAGNAPGGSIKSSTASLAIRIAASKSVVMDSLTFATAVGSK